MTAAIRLGVAVVCVGCLALSGWIVLGGRV